MMEFLRFTFSSFWIWGGMLLLILAAGQSVALIVGALRSAK